MQKLKLNAVDHPIIDIFDHDKMSDAEVIAAAKAIEEQRLNQPNKGAQICATSQSEATSTPGSSRA
jgi:hypothetical protein